MPEYIERKTPNLFTIIAAIESGGDQYALRYEPLWKYTTQHQINVCAKINRISRDTAKMLLASSFGKYQIMGSVLLELGYNGKLISEFIQSAPLQDVYFELYCKSRNIFVTVEDLKSQTVREKFARFYNGPGNVSVYSAKLRAELMQQGVKGVV